MAIDEAILNEVNNGQSPPTLRFYQWDQPTISLGYFQKIDQHKQQDTQITDMPVVRRQTGGGAILHDDELTYSLILPTTNKSAAAIEDMYTLVHACYIKAMATWNIPIQYRGTSDDGNSQRGPFFCFARGHKLDLVIADDKVLGSAQRRLNNAVLQHGSLILKRHYQQQPCAEIKKICPEFDTNIFMQDTANLIAIQLDMNIEHESITPNEKNLATELQNKYSGDNWNAQR
ncbi:MAG: hypothetical protein JEZ07_04555 [Phycisphaerae bacterium]|nr:hypothetical protein [Phycisphaerae bacterium]